ncbi:MAG TPA: hypothetical protein VM050_05300 [Patescibacteria group bacterium]|nr:hypothetical protein [Patescibacteria group bacterium]
MNGSNRPLAVSHTRVGDLQGWEHLTARTGVTLLSRARRRPGGG